MSAAKWLLAPTTRRYTDGTSGVWTDPDWTDISGYSGPIELTLLANSIDAVLSTYLVEIIGRVGGADAGRVIATFPRMGGQAIVSANVPLYLPLRMTTFPPEIRTRVTWDVSSGGAATSQYGEFGISIADAPAGPRLFYKEFAAVTVTTATAIIPPYPVGMLRSYSVTIGNATGGAVLTDFDALVAGSQNHFDAAATMDPEELTGTEFTALDTLAAGSSLRFNRDSKNDAWLKCHGTCGTSTTVQAWLVGEYL